MTKLKDKYQQLSKSKKTQLIIAMALTASMTVSMVAYMIYITVRRSG